MDLGTKEIALKWGISERRVRKLCSEGKVEGAFLDGKTWLIPENAIKPKDGREATAIYLSKIKTMKKELDSLRPLTQEEVKALNSEFSIEYTYNSNAIEGNTLTLRETELVLRGLTIDKKPLKDHLEVVGHKEAFDYICDLVKEKNSLSEFIIKQIHYLVLANSREDRGIYRKIPVRIAGALITPVDPCLIQEDIEKLINWYKKDSNDDFLTKLALLHIYFESIHPFIDGNGRTGRLIVNLELMKLGYPPIDIKFTDRKKYYAAFDYYARNKSPNAMVRLFSKYLIGRLNTYIKILAN